MPIKLQGSMQYLWSKISLWSTEKNETILILIGLKRFESVWNVIFRILKNQYLT